MAMLHAGFHVLTLRCQRTPLLEQLVYGFQISSFRFGNDSYHKYHPNGAQDTVHPESPGCRYGLRLVKKKIVWVVLISIFKYLTSSRGWYVLMTTNITARLNEPARELNKLLCAVGNNSPIKRNGMQPNPMENPIINTMRLATGRYLVKKKCIFFLVQLFKLTHSLCYPKLVLPIELR